MPPSAGRPAPPNRPASQCLWSSLPSAASAGSACSAVLNAAPRSVRRAAFPHILERWRQGFALIRRHDWAGRGNAEKPPDLLLPGRGRGSSVSTLVGYLGRLSHVGPLDYGLSLDRCLSKDTESYPDIDLDFPRDVRSMPGIGKARADRICLTWRRVEPGYRATLRSISAECRPAPARCPTGLRCNRRRLMDARQPGGARAAGTPPAWSKLTGRFLMPYPRCKRHPTRIPGVQCCGRRIRASIARIRNARWQAMPLCG